MRRQQRSPIPALPVMPDSLRQISKTLAEIKATAFMDHTEFLRQYVPRQGREAIEDWHKVWHQCLDAKAAAEKDVARPEMTVADGLPQAFIDLDERLEAAKRVHGEYEEVASNLWSVANEPTRFKIGSGTLELLAKKAHGSVSGDRNAASQVVFQTELAMKPKVRSGTIVRRVRQEFFSKYQEQRYAAGEAAYRDAMKKLGGWPLKRKAEAAEQAGEDRQKAAIRVLSERLEAEITAYLAERGEPDVAKE